LRFEYNVDIQGHPGRHRNRRSNGTCPQSTAVRYRPVGVDRTGCVVGGWRRRRDERREPHHGLCGGGRSARRPCRQRILHIGQWVHTYDRRQLCFERSFYEYTYAFTYFDTSYSGTNGDGKTSYSGTNGDGKTSYSGTNGDGKTSYSGTNGDGKTSYSGTNGDGKTSYSGTNGDGKTSYSGTNGDANGDGHTGPGL
jgi:hypothetical protein